MRFDLRQVDLEQNAYGEFIPWHFESVRYHQARRLLGEIEVVVNVQLGKHVVFHV